MPATAYAVRGLASVAITAPIRKPTPGSAARGLEQADDARL